MSLDETATPDPEGLGLPSCLSAALDYAKWGGKVLPLWWIDPVTKQCACGRQKGCEGGKLRGAHPIWDCTPHGVANASSDPLTILVWWHQHPRANLGIATGLMSGVWALLIKPPLGEESLQSRSNALGALHCTLCFVADDDSMVYLFSWDDGVRDQVLVDVGLETRSDGGYVVAPPSILEGHCGFDWVDGVPPGPFFKPAPAPEAWIAYIVEQGELCPWVKPFDPYVD